MTSQAKVAANRRNGRKSSGPHSTAGKARTSRNALRHGLAAINPIDSIPSEEIDTLASVLCEEDDRSTLLFARAQVVARNQMILRTIREQQNAVIERVRDPSKVALAKRDDGRNLVEARERQTMLADKRIDLLLPNVLEKYRDQLQGKDLDDKFFPTDRVRLALKLLLEEPSPEEEQRAREHARNEIEQEQRDEHDALKAAMPDLIRLDRYERRAWSQYARAVRDFLNIKNFSFQ